MFRELPCPSLLVGIVIAERRAQRRARQFIVDDYRFGDAQTTELPQWRPWRYSPLVICEAQTAGYPVFPT